jgi:isochorismate synthase
LNAHSTTQRRLYAGTIGLRFNSGDELHFVNLRCMQVFDDHFELHVGGGVVAGSSREEEWQETEMKADVLRRFLQ